ncbi:hypothetical protein GCM10027440_26010 [Nocardiopsis coralliicola]
MAYGTEGETSRISIEKHDSDPDSSGRSAVRAVTAGHIVKNSSRRIGPIAPSGDLHSTTEGHHPFAPSDTKAQSATQCTRRYSRIGNADNSKGIPGEYPGIMRAL